MINACSYFFVFVVCCINLVNLRKQQKYLDEQAQVS